MWKLLCWLFRETTGSCYELTAQCKLILSSIKISLSFLLWKRQTINLIKLVNLLFDKQKQFSKTHYNIKNIFYLPEKENLFIFNLMSSLEQQSLYAYNLISSLKSPENLVFNLSFLLNLITKRFKTYFFLQLFACES